MDHDYQVVGEGPFGVTEDGGILYDLLDSREEAEDICRLLTEGVLSDWDTLEQELKRRYMRWARA